jgi:hypothetical protein
VLPVHKKGDKTDCSNCRGISLLSTLYKILSHILLATLAAYGDEIIGDRQYGCWRNRSMTDQIFYIWQILEKKWAIHRFQENIQFSLKGSIIQYSH